MTIVALRSCGVVLRPLNVVFRPDGQTKKWPRCARGDGCERRETLGKIRYVDLPCNRLSFDVLRVRSGGHDRRGEIDWKINRHRHTRIFY